MEERVGYQISNEGEKIFGILHRPRLLAKCPIVLILHGFAGHKIGQQRLYVALAQQLAAAGIAALRFDFRGCGDSEGEYDRMTLSGMLSDAVNVLHSLKSLEGVDSARVGIVGVSLGGLVAAQLAAAHPEKVHALALLAPVASGKQWVADRKLHSTKEGEFSWSQSLGKTLHGQFVEEFLSADGAGALTRCDHIPLLHFQGDEDDNVRPSHALLYRQSRAKANAISRFEDLPGCGHDFSQAHQRVLRETAAWFSFHFLTKEHT
jgi:hypothetical protein